MPALVRTAIQFPVLGNPSISVALFWNCKKAWTLSSDRYGQNPIYGYWNMNRGLQPSANLLCQGKITEATAQPMRMNYWII